jgi:hypothetical protein
MAQRSKSSLATDRLTADANEARRMNPDDYPPCNFEELQNQLECISMRSLAPSHSWQEVDFSMPAINVRF